MNKYVLLFMLFALGSCGGGDSAPQEVIIPNESELDEYLGSWSTNCVDLNTLSVNSIDPPLYLTHSYNINEHTISKTIGFYDDPDCLEFNSDFEITSPMSLAPSRNVFSSLIYTSLEHRLE